MQGFERLREFNRAVRASRLEAAAQWNPYLPQVQDFNFAEGLLFGVALALPFWISLAFAIELLTR